MVKIVKGKGKGEVFCEKIYYFNGKDLGFNWKSSKGRIRRIYRHLNLIGNLNA